MEAVSAVLEQSPPLGECCQGQLTAAHCAQQKLIRAGRYSTIHVAQCPAVGGPVAIKAYHQPDLSARKRHMATREAIVLKYLNSQCVPNVPELLGAYAAGPQFHLVTEYFPGGDLLAALGARKGRGMPEAEVARIAVPLLCTLDAMHSAGVVHRDIKLENIFVAADGSPRLGDFDLAVFTHAPPPRAPVGTVPYMAPELFLLASYRGSPLEPAILSRLGPPLDVWSLGVCLFELAAGHKPFQGVSFQGVASAVLTNARAPLPAAASAAFADFLDAALTHDAAARPTAGELLRHPWVAAARRRGGAGAQNGAAAAANGGGGAQRSDSAGSLEELQARASKQLRRGITAAATAVVATSGSSSSSSAAAAAVSTAGAAAAAATVAAAGLPPAWLAAAAGGGTLGSSGSLPSPLVGGLFTSSSELSGSGPLAAGPPSSAGSGSNGSNGSSSAQSGRRRGSARLLRWLLPCVAPQVAEGGPVAAA